MRGVVSCAIGAHGESGGFALIAESDDGADQVTIWNCKGLAGSVLVEAGHLVGGEAERGGLQREVGRGRAQVIESNTVRGIVVAEFGSGHAENQNRRVDGPSLVGATSVANIFL